MVRLYFFFFFQAEDGIRDYKVTGVQTCALPILAHLVGLPAKHLRVHRLHEGVHAIEALWCRAGRQPFEIAVGTRDIAVRAGRDVDDDFATLRHESDLPRADTLQPSNGSRLSCGA